MRRYRSRAVHVLPHGSLRPAFVQESVKVLDLTAEDADTAPHEAHPIPSALALALPIAPIALTTTAANAAPVVATAADNDLDDDRRHERVRPRRRRGTASRTVAIDNVDGGRAVSGPHAGRRIGDRLPNGSLLERTSTPTVSATPPVHEGHGRRRRPDAGLRETDIDGDGTDRQLRRRDGHRRRRQADGRLRRDRHRRDCQGDAADSESDIDGDARRTTPLARQTSTGTA